MLHPVRQHQRLQILKRSRIMLLVVAAGWRLAFAAVSASMDRAQLRVIRANRSESRHDRLVDAHCGPLVPLVPYLLTAGVAAFTSSLLASLGALFVLGLSISRLTRRNPLGTALRQVLLGGIAAAVTFAVGAFIGVRI